MKKALMLVAAFAIVTIGWYGPASAAVEAGDKASPDQMCVQLENTPAAHDAMCSYKVELAEPLEASSDCRQYECDPIDGKCLVYPICGDDESCNPIDVDGLAGTTTVDGQKITSVSECGANASGLCLFQKHIRASEPAG